MDKIRMKQQVIATPDHLNPHVYEKGEIHIVGSNLMPQTLAELLIARKHAEEVTEVQPVKIEDNPPPKVRRPGPSETKGYIAVPKKKD